MEPRSDRPTTRPVSLAEHRIASPAFAGLFRQGMDLVDQTAAYLDGQGRIDSRDMSRTALTAYAAQSTRLSTRLMQLASWLLLQRAVLEGEMSPQTAEREKARIDLDGPHPDAEHESLLPSELAALVTRSYELQREISCLDRALDAAPATRQDVRPNAVASQIGRLRNAFERR